jgi:hypothetical protein
MSIGAKDYGERDFRAGLRALVRHRPDVAARSLRAASAACPADAASALERRLYWLALALLRLDQAELALKSLASAQKLRPRGHARMLYLRLANDYGMPRRGNPDVDDLYAFYSIQTAAYFSGKRKACFGDAAEKDAVVRLVGDAWLSLSRSGRLHGLDPSAKIRLFRESRVDFPSFALSRGMPCRIVKADFRKKIRLGGEERCPCGSGLPYQQCCGRIAGLGELKYE